MHYLADLHIHSHYAGATSRFLTLEKIWQWAQVKGIRVMATGDFTHPGWSKELKEKLVEDGSGFLRFRQLPTGTALPSTTPMFTDVRFCLSTEACCNYVYDGRRRRNHLLIYTNSFETANRINKSLSRYGDLSLDGRPTLSLSSRNLLEIVLNASPSSYVVPAHAWTPWFSTLGIYGGYESVAACFRDLTKHIFALETGLSSDPAMNWRCSALDGLTMLSSSDAHSPQKIGREVNLFETDLNYDSMFNAIKTGVGFKGTYECYAETGKYSGDGHRNCGVSFTMEETERHKSICPVCGKSLIIGVFNRLGRLADRSKPQQPARASNYRYIVPLPALLSEIHGAKPESKKVQAAFCHAIKTFGNEFNLMCYTPGDVLQAYSPVLHDVLKKVRNGDVQKCFGYDGVYGRVQLFANQVIQPTKQRQLSMF